MVTDNDLERILAQALEETKSSNNGDVNLAEISRKTGISRKKLRRWKNNGYHLPPDKRGRRPGSIKLRGYTEKIDSLLAEGVTNSEVILAFIRKDGFAGQATIVKNYISSHKDLVPLPRKVEIPHPERARRWYTRRLLPDGLGLREGRG